MPSNSFNTNQQGAAESSLGRFNFAALTGLDTPERQERLAHILAKIDEEKLEVIRVAFVDTHGIVRMRPIEARLFAQAVRNGVPFTTAFFAMDSANNIFQNVFAHDGGFGRETMGGAGDMLAIPDLSSFRVLPWAYKCAWVVSDLYLSSGERCPFDPRLIIYSLRVFDQAGSTSKVMESRNSSPGARCETRSPFWGAKNGETCLLAGDSDGTEP